jgi:hypothetical protein
MKDRLIVLSVESIPPPTFGHQPRLSRGVGGVAVEMVETFAESEVEDDGISPRFTQALVKLAVSVFWLKAARALTSTMLKASTATIPAVR